MNNCSIVGIAVAVCLISGCADIYTDYGQSKGLQGRNSVNGFGALRTAYEQAGFRSRDITRLSNRVRRSDVIVWTPKTFDAVDPRVTRWFDRWLRQGGRTLVYVVPDSGSEADYWRDAARLAPPDQRLEYRKRAGRCINQRIQWRLNRAAVGSNGWFQIQPLERRRLMQKVEGPWQEIWRPADKQNPPSHADAAIELVVVAYDPEEAGATSTPTTVLGANAGPTLPGSPGWISRESTEATKTPLQYSPLLALDAESPIVGEVRSESWQDSKIIVVAGGSLLTNYGFSREPNRRLADKIIAASTPIESEQTLAGFLTSDWNVISVSDRTPGTPQASGMEMLTEWPISLVTMHGVVLGIVVCLMLLPIFGRPRRLRRTETNDFGHHLDAVAALMMRVGGETYARGRISDYMKRVHGETSGPWVLPNQAAPAAQALLSAVPRVDTEQLPSSADQEPDQKTGQLGGDSESDPNHPEPSKNHDEADL